MIEIILALTAAFLWSSVSIIDKHVLDDELKDPIISTVIYCTSMFLIFFITAILFGRVVFGIGSIIGMAVGVIYGLAIAMYYRALKLEEVSRVVPLIMTTPLFVLLIATILFGEIFTSQKYVGLILLIVGCILLSIKKGRMRVGALCTAIVTALLFSFRNIFLKFSLLEIDVFSTLFWMAVGGLIISLVLFAFHHPHIRTKTKIRGIEHLALAGVLSAIAFFLFTFATVLGYISVVTAIASIQVLFVFIIAALFSRFKPGFIHEEMRETTLEMKMIAIIFIMTGLIIIS